MCVSNPKAVLKTPVTVSLALVQELSPLLPKALDMTVADEESMDCPSSVDQSFNDTCSYQGDSVADNTPTSSKKKKVFAHCVFFFILIRF